MTRRAVCLVALAAAACGPDKGAYEPLRLERCEPTCDPIDAGVDAGENGEGVESVPLEDWDLEGAGPLTGIFAVEVIVKANVVVPIESRQLYRMRLLQRGQVVRQRASICRLLLPSITGLAEITVPPALERVMASRSAESEGAFLSSDAPIGATYTPTMDPIVLGAVLADPAKDPLPTKDDLGAAADDDRDGHPGVTLEATTLTCDDRVEQLYAALRTSAALAGLVEDIDTIVGVVTPTLDQSVLGQSHSCLAPAAGLVIEIIEGSTFRGRRVGDAEDLDENGNVSCDELILAAPALFGELWQPGGAEEE
jgi:hypothetical protein